MNQKDAIYQPHADTKAVLNAAEITEEEVNERKKHDNEAKQVRRKSLKKKAKKKQTKHNREEKQQKRIGEEKNKEHAVRNLDSLNQPDSTLELSLRPARFADFTGQRKVKERLEIAIAAAKRRGDVLDHILFNGPPGLGKTTLANVVAKAMNAGLKNTSGPTIEKAGDLAGLLTNLERGDVLFIDEIHRMQKNIEEYLYPAMEDFKLDIIIDQGPNARSVRINLPNFTLIGATTRSGLLSSPLLSRFSIKERLDYYTAEELCDIVVRSSRLLDVPIKEDGAWEIARRSRGTPRIANNLLRRVRDYTQVRHNGNITKAIADQGLAMLDIDQNGLDEMDKRILEAIIGRFDGGPVGIHSLAVAVGEEADTLESVYEPWLIMEGYLKRTPQGRTATKTCYEKLGLSPPKTNDDQSELLLKNSRPPLPN